MKIAVIDDYQDVFTTLGNFHRLKDHQVVTFSEPERDVDRLVEKIKDCDAVVLTQQRTWFPRSLIERLPNLKLICQTGGTAHIDLEACTERGIVVSAGGGPRLGGGPNDTAAIAWSLILSSLRHIPQEVAALKAGGWQTTLGTSLFGKTLGIYALGNIGGVVAAAGKAFEMNVLCWGRDASLRRAEQLGYEVAASREAFFERSDVISLHLPLNAETRGIVTAADLGRMKPTALIVNTSRAGLIEDGALEAALKQGRPGFAGVDVFEEEPVLNAGHPLLQMDNVVATPHLGYVTRERYEVFYEATIDQAMAFAAGEPILVQNPDVLKK
jgi:D-3-phosphoglycerate dehydrogenase